MKTIILDSKQLRIRYANCLQSLLQKLVENRGLLFVSMSSDSGEVELIDRQGYSSPEDSMPFYPSPENAFSTTKGVAPGSYETNEHEHFASAVTESAKFAIRKEPVVPLRENRYRSTKFRIQIL